MLQEWQYLVVQHSLHCWRKVAKGSLYWCFMKFTFGECVHYNVVNKYIYYVFFALGNIWYQLVKYNITKNNQTFSKLYKNISNGLLCFMNMMLILFCHKVILNCNINASIFLKFTVCTLGTYMLHFIFHLFPTSLPRMYYAGKVLYYIKHVQLAQIKHE